MDNQQFNPAPQIQPQEEMQPAAPVNKVNSAAVNGLKLAVISIIFSLIASFVPQNSFGRIFSFILTLCKLGATVTFLWWAMKTYSVKNAAAVGFTTYGNAFSYGFLTSLFSGIILAAYTFVSMKWIMPETVQAMKDAYLLQLENMPGMDSSLLENVMNNLEVLSTFSMLLMAVIYGLIFSLIIASSVKIEPNRMQGFDGQI